MTSVDPIPPPVEVALARRVDRLPGPDALPGGAAYEPKFDGHRLVVLTSPVRLQTRSGRLVTERFPEIAEAAERLPPGTVLDGELVIWNAGRLDFTALQRRALSAAHRTHTAAALTANLAAFDLLAYDGADWRTRPYTERRDGLEALLTPLGPPIQPVPMTTDPGQAAAWYEALRPVGIEGLVVKGRTQPYRPGRRDWLKVRHAEPRDAAAVGVIGSFARPRALVLELGDDRVASAPLSAPVRGEVVAALSAADRSRPTGPPDAALEDGTTYRTLNEPLLVEALQSTTRDARTTVLRVRSELG